MRHRTSTRRSVALTWLLALTLPLSPGCGHDASDHDHDHDHGHDHSHDDGDHAHEARNGGTLVVLAEEFAHMEVLVDPATGAVTAWALGPHCENYEKLAQASIALTVDAPGVEPFTVELLAVASGTTGETVGDTSRFAATDARLVGVERFDGTFGAITSRGQTFDTTSFPYPDGTDERAETDRHDH
jgi:hypothetical protein